MKSFKEKIQLIEAESLANSKKERPLLRPKIDRARACVMDAADDLATKTTDAADLVAVAAIERCVGVVEEAQRSAARVFSSIPYDDLMKLEAEWRTDWTREAMVRIIERRSE